MAKKKSLPQVRDHEPIPVNQWKGLYSRGIKDSVPLGYFSDSLNLQYRQKEFKTRDGFTKDITLANIRRYFIYKRLNETPRYLILTTGGDLFDSLYPGTPIVSNADFLDFSAVNFLNRAYITFHNRVQGISGSYLYIYEGGGPGTIRFAAGSAPSGFTLNVATSASTGNVEAGTHLFAWAFETSSGFITAPGPEVFAVYTAPGGFKVDFSNAPIGPDGTVARRLLATKVIPSYDGNQFGYEFFFVPNGRVGDNTTTALNGVDFFDDDLQSSADYLFDSMPTIPAGLGLTVYNNRLLMWGIPGYEHYVFCSKAIEVELVDSTAGLIYIDPSDAISPITNIVDHREAAYIFTRNRTFVTVDNGGDPDTWQAPTVDKAVGTEVFGVSKILDSRGTNTDRFFVANTKGCYQFEEGTFKKPEFSWNISDIWKRINKDYFNLVQVDHDPQNCIVYIAVPLDSATECSHLLVADYSQSFNQFGQIAPPNVRWDIWQFPWTISSIAVDVKSDLEVALKIAGLEGNIYYQDPDSALDDSTRIDYRFRTGYIYQLEGWIHHFGFLSFRAEGVGTLSINVYGLNDIISASVPAVTLSALPGQDYYRPINIESPKMAVKFTGNTNAGDKVTFDSLVVDCKPVWAETPGV